MMNKKLFRVYVTGTLGIDIQALSVEDAERKIQAIIDDSEGAVSEGDLYPEHQAALDSLQGREIQAGETEEFD